MNKNLTPKQIALYTALIISAVCFALTSGLLIYLNNINWLAIFGVAAAMFLLSYFLLLFFIERFIYENIKRIYKTIYPLKKPSDKLTDPKSDIIQDVNEKVLDWAKDRSAEIEELRKNEHYRREFLANVAHELKTPIFSIQGYLHTLLDGGIDDLNINMNYLYKAAKNTDRLCAIVEDLDIISGLESGEIELYIEKFDLYELAKDVLESLENQAAKENITLQIKEVQAKNLFVNADKERIRQVLVNLVSNSIKYGKKGGKTTVSFFTIDGKILTEIKDKGIGIEEKHLARIFERFYRIDSARSREQGGTGLGLAIVKHFIEKHNQVIRVQSQYNEGTTFSFTLDKA